MFTSSIKRQIRTRRSHAVDVKVQCTKKRDARALNRLFFEVVVIVVVVCSSNSESQVNRK